LTNVAPCMQISEASISTNCRNIIIPCGKNKDNGCQLFTRTLEEIGTATRVLFPPHQVSGFSFFLFRVCVYANAFSILQRQQIYIPSEEPTELADAKMLRALQHHNQMWSLHATKVIAVDLQK